MDERVELVVVIPIEVGTREPDQNEVPEPKHGCSEGYVRRVGFPGAQVSRATDPPRASMMIDPLSPPLKKGP